MYIDYLANHLDAVPRLASWFFDEWAGLHPERTEADVVRLVAERAHTGRLPLALVAIEAGQVIGTAAIKVHDMETRLDLTPWLAGLYVAPQWRRRGVATQLVAAVENAAAELGIGRLYLYTPAAESFYARLGWAAKENTQYRGHAVVVMEKAIGR